MSAKETANSNKQPLGLYLLALGTFCERFSYYGAQAILVLYFTKIFLFSDDASYAMYGVYTTFAFALPVIGGIFADQCIGNKSAIIIGSIFLIVGNILLSFHESQIFLIGLGILVCGTGLYKSSISALVGKLYKPNNQSIARRDNGYIIFYIAMNIGASLGGVIYGLSTNFSGFLSWRMGFVFSSILMTMSLITFLILHKHIDLQSGFQKTQENSLAKMIAYSSGLVGVFAVIFVFFNPTLLKYLLMIFCLFFPWFICFISKYAKEEKLKIISVLLYLPFVVAFFTASFQIASSVTLFINSYIYHTLNGWNIPPSFFSALYPISVIVAAPLVGFLFHQLLKKYDYQIITSSKIAMGLFACSIAFFCFTTAGAPIYANTSLYPLTWIVGGIFLIGLGEALIFPALLSDMSKLIPPNLQTTLMGVSFLAVAFSGYLSGLVYRLMEGNTTSNGDVSLAAYHHFFFIIAIVSIMMAVILFFLRPFFLRLIKDQATT